MSKKEKEPVGKYMEVWGDTVAPKELAIAAVICVALTMIFFLAGRKMLMSIPSLDYGLAKGYSLLIGIIGTFIGAAISAKKFPPKRKIMIQAQEESLEEILAAAGMTVEEEREALANVSPEIIKELEDYELWQLLALIPEDSANYKPEYKLNLAKKGGETA